MQTLIVSPDLTITLYESVREMPASLYQIARQYEVMAAELGASEAEQDAMLERAIGFAQTGKLDDFNQQLSNYRLARQLTKDKFQPGQLDWACHVASVNGQSLTDYSEDTLLRYIEEWSQKGLTQQLIEATLDDVKKNAGLN